MTEKVPFWLFLEILGPSARCLTTDWYTLLQMRHKARLQALTIGPVPELAQREPALGQLWCWACVLLPGGLLDHE